jgi:hypothetical protein
MNTLRGLRTIGTEIIDGRQVEFLAADGVNFVTAQFVDANPRGIANLLDLHKSDPRVVPLSHGAWVAGEGRELQLIAAARAALGLQVPSPPDGPRRREFAKDEHPPDERNDDAASLFNRRRTQAIRTR